jgi:hypothetical protein
MANTGRIPRIFPVPYGHVRCRTGDDCLVCIRLFLVIFFLDDTDSGNSECCFLEWMTGPACIPDGSCLLEVSLRRILRAVDRTLPCGSEPFSADCLDLGSWTPISCWSYAISSFPPPFNDEECTRDTFFSAWACWNSARSCLLKNDLSVSQGWKWEDQSHHEVALATQCSHQSLSRKP